MSFLDKVADFFHKFFDWATDADTVERLKNLTQIVFLVVTTISKLNDEPSNSRKRELAWRFVQFLKYVDPQDLRQIADLHESSGIAKLETDEIDALCGLTISEHVRERRVFKGVKNA